MNIYGEILPEPKLRFDYSSSLAQDLYSKRGLRNYGPYDSNLFNLNKVTCVILYHSSLIGEKTILESGLKTGEGSFQGFQEFFKIPMEFVDAYSYSDERSLIRALDEIYTINPKYVFTLLPERGTIYYTETKSRLLANGIPNQGITANVIRNRRGRQFTLENLALSCYAKIGGHPWTVSAPSAENNLILGISRARDASGKYIVGFVTVFANDGDYLFFNSKTPVVEWSEYVNGLAELVKSSFIDFKDQRGVPDNIILHFYKRPGIKELTAIESVFNEIEMEIPYALVHVNDNSNFRLFDTSHNTYIPPKGLKVNLTAREALILIDGRINNRRFRMGVPNIIHVRMDKRSTIDRRLFSDLVSQVFNFSRVNWRGFNAAQIPVTINYSKLIAKMIIEVGINNWNHIIAEGKLRDKAWFL